MPHVRRRRRLGQGAAQCRPDVVPPPVSAGPRRRAAPASGPTSGKRRYCAAAIAAPPPGGRTVTRASRAAARPTYSGARLEQPAAARIQQAELQGQRPQPLFGVVAAQLQAVLGARGEHAVRLGDLLGDQVVDQHAEVGLAAAERQLAPGRRDSRAAFTPAIRPWAAASS